MGFWSKFVAAVGVIAAPFTGGLSLIATGVALAAPKAVDKIFDSVINFVVQPFMGILDTPGANQGEAERQKGVLISRTAGGDTAIPVIYGLRRVGGLVTYAETGSTNNRYLYVAYVFSEGCVSGLYEVLIDDIAIPSDLIGSLNYGSQVKITTGKFANRVEMRWVPGVYFASPGSSQLGTELKATLFKDAPSFTSTMTYNGLATLFVRFEWLDIKTQADADSNPFGGSIPQITATIMGRRVAPLTTGTTSESYTYEGAGYTERYSTNPAEILLDYLRNPRYGKGLKNADIDFASFRTAAAKCNTDVTYVASGVRGPILTCNHVLDTNQTLFNNVKTLLTGFRAYMPYVQGRYYLRIEDAGNPTSITSGAATIIAECRNTPVQIDNFATNTYEIVGSVQYSGIDRAHKYNHVVVTYVDPNNKYSNQQAVYPQTEAERQVYITEDGGRENKIDVTMPTITNAAMASDFARLIFFKSRYQETCNLRVTSHAFELEPGDNIRIRSQLLNFADTPWRVINITYNNDYTFSLSCVRNPDWLYPYTTAFEPDIVLPIYIPRGIEIYVPDSQPNIGLIPPTRSPYNPGAKYPADPTILNPVPSDPTGGTGGGVGGGSGSVNTDPVNNQPPAAPRSQPLDTIVDFTRAEAVVENGLTYIRLTFAQPDHAMYAGLVLYYKNTSSAGSYSNYTETTIPGIGRTVTFNLGPVAVISTISTNTIDVYARVRYTDGSLSSRFVRLQVGTTTGVITNPSETIQNSATSWPRDLVVDERGTTPVQPTPSPRDTKIETVTGLVAAAGTAGNPRPMRFDITQDVRTQAANFDVNGVRIYWKLATDTYYNTKAYKFANYSPGTTYQLTFDGDIGVWGGSTSYDFAFRLTYVDNTESSSVYTTRWTVESPYVVYPYDPSYGASRTVKLFSTANIITVDQAPPGAVANPLETKYGIGSANAGINQIEVNGAVSGIKIFLDPPDISNRSTWRGTTVRTRAIVPGTNPALTSQIYRNVALNSQSGILLINHYPWTADQRYEIIITPRVVSGGVEQDSNVSLFGRGYVHNRTISLDYPANRNWGPSFNFTQMNTRTALQTAGQPFDASNPSIDLISYEVILDPATSDGYVKTGSTSLRLGSYFRLVYNGDKIAGLTALYIYRRNRITSFGPTGYFGQSTSGRNYATHYGVGQWERVVVSHSGTGNKIVNLRWPTDHREFDPYYNVAGYTGRTLKQQQIGEVAGCVPLSGVLYTDLLIIAVVSSTVSTKGIFIPGLSQSVFTNNRWNLLNNRYDPIVWADEATIKDSSYTAGYLRRISDARTTAVPSSLWQRRPAYQALRIYNGTTAITISDATPIDGPAVV